MHLETVVVSPFPFVTASRGIGKPVVVTVQIAELREILASLYKTLNNLYTILKILLLPWNAVRELLLLNLKNKKNYTYLQETLKKKRKLILTLQEKHQKRT